MAADPPDIDGAREAARRTIRDGNRASDVMKRLRALFSKREFTLEPVDLSEAAREVLALSSNDLWRNRISLQSELADNLPRVAGDRIQLLQLILNLLRNASDAMVDVPDRPRQRPRRHSHERAGDEGRSRRVPDQAVQRRCAIECDSRGIDRTRAALRLDSEMRLLRNRHELLTPRKREVMVLVVSGLLNKQVGGELGISEIT